MWNDPLILVLNAGSSSLKLAAFAGDRVELRAAVERTNHTAGEPRLRLEDGDRRELEGVRRGGPRVRPLEHGRSAHPFSSTHCVA